MDEERVERRPRKRKAALKPASRQYMMMGVGVLNAAAVDYRYRLRAESPSTSSSEPSASGENYRLLSGNAASQANATRKPAPGAALRRTNRGQYVAGYFVAAPISSTPTRRDGRLWSLTVSSAWKCRDDLNSNALTRSEQMNNVAVNSTFADRACNRRASSQWQHDASGGS